MISGAGLGKLLMGGTLSIQASYGKRHFPHFRRRGIAPITLAQGSLTAGGRTLNIFSALTCEAAKGESRLQRPKAPPRKVSLRHVRKELGSSDRH